MKTTTETMLATAARMYGKEVPPVLSERLLEINRLAALCGGGLVSRQVIAMVVEQYKREEG